MSVFILNILLVLRSGVSFLVYEMSYITKSALHSHVSALSASVQTMAEYSSLLSDLSENITNEDLEQLKSACKEDIPEDQSNNITSSKEWFSYLEKNDKLAQGKRHRDTDLVSQFSCKALYT